MSPPAEETAETGVRRRRRARRGRGDPDAAVLPLINVAFLLLIFVLLAGRLSEADPFGIAPPRAAAAGDAAGAAAGPPRVLLSADGRLALDGREMARAALTDAIRARMAEAPGPVRLVADAAAPAGALTRLAADLVAAGATEARLETVRPGTTP